MWMARYQRKSKPTCPQCGGDPDECGDAKKKWYPQRTICQATMETAAANARYDALHPEGFDYHGGDFRNWGPESADRPYGHRDGVTIWSAPVDLNPDDDFLAAAVEQVETEPHPAD